MAFSSEKTKAAILIITTLTANKNVQNRYSMMPVIPYSQHFNSIDGPPLFTTIPTPTPKTTVKWIQKELIQKK
jgi:hypothetical protein